MVLRTRVVAVLATIEGDFHGLALAVGSFGDQRAHTFAAFVHFASFQRRRKGEKRDVEVVVEQRRRRQQKQKVPR